jgi:hypothetical protein
MRYTACSRCRREIPAHQNQSLMLYWIVRDIIVSPELIAVVALYLSPRVKRLWNRGNREQSDMQQSLGAWHHTSDIPA